MSELAALQSAVEEVRGDVKQLLQDQASTAAKLDVLTGQAEAQIGVLFARREKDVERVQAIELDYTPRKEHDELRTRVGHIDRQVQKWIGALALLQVALSLAGAWLMKAVMG